MGQSIMFQITQLDTDSGLVIVEDKDFGLRYEFKEPELQNAKIIDDYDLHITTKAGEKIAVPILNRWSLIGDPKTQRTDLIHP